MPAQFKPGQVVRIRDADHPRAEQLVRVDGARETPSGVVYSVLAEGKHAFDLREEQVDLPPKGWRPKAAVSRPQPGPVDVFKAFG